MNVEVDPFAQNFRQVVGSRSALTVGNRGILFRYYYAGNSGSHRDWAFMAGLWVSEEFSWSQIQTYHDMPDRECDRTVAKSGAHHRPSSIIWLGLPIIQLEDNGNITTQFTIPSGIIKDFGALAISPEVPIRVELEQRFGVAIVAA